MNIYRESEEGEIGIEKAQIEVLVVSKLFGDWLPSGSHHSFHGMIPRFGVVNSPNTPEVVSSKPRPN